jgi:hypothetical protein
MDCATGSSGSGCLCASGGTPPSAFNTGKFKHVGDKNKLELRVMEDFDCEGTTYKCVEVKKGDIVRIKGTSSHSATFVYVRRETSPRTKGFLPRRILKALAPTSNFAPGSANSGVRLGEILTPRRSFPGRPYMKLLRLSMGERLQVLAIPLSGQTYKVKRLRDGEVGYVYTNFVQRLPNAEYVPLAWLNN